MITYLYIKTHNVTGLKYFGKTVQNPFTYKGSGKYWKQHLKKHGNDVSTEILGEFTDAAECEAAAIRFSQDHNIVESNEWANLIDENGLDGAPVGHIGHKFTDAQLSELSTKLRERWSDPDYKQRLSDTHKQRWADGVLKVKQSTRLRTEFWTDERKAAHAAKMTGRPANEKFVEFTRSQRTDEHKQAISKALSGRAKTEEHKQKLKKPKPLVVCRIEDRKLMALGNFMNWYNRITSDARDKR